jgi:hypothetical protein
MFAMFEFGTEIKPDSQGKLFANHLSDVLAKPGISLPVDHEMSPRYKSTTWFLFDVFFSRSTDDWNDEVSSLLKEHHQEEHELKQEEQIYNRIKRNKTSSDKSISHKLPFTKMGGCFRGIVPPASVAGKVEATVHLETSSLDAFLLQLLEGLQSLDSV